LKRFLAAALLCALVLIPAWTQEEIPESLPQEEVSVSLPQEEVSASRPNFFVRFWRGFAETLFTPQIHKPFSVAAGIEAAQNDRVNLLPQIFIASDYELSRYFGLGVRGGLSFGSSEPTDRIVSVMEGAFYGRFYVYDFGWIRPYVQTGIGISVDREQEFEYTDVLGEFGLGVRAHYTGWFLDTGFRYGYPFRIAFGLSLGHSFLP
jgi:hypothetical protein